MVVSGFVARNLNILNAGGADFESDVNSVNESNCCPNNVVMTIFAAFNSDNKSGERRASATLGSRRPAAAGRGLKFVGLERIHICHGNHEEACYLGSLVQGTVRDGIQV